MIVAKSIKELGFLKEEDEGKISYIFPPHFIYAYYKVFELLGYENDIERKLCEEQLSLLKSLSSVYVFYEAKSKGTHLAKRIILEYNTGFNGLDDTIQKFIDKKINF